MDYQKKELPIEFAWFSNEVMLRCDSLISVAEDSIVRLLVFTCCDLSGNKVIMRKCDKFVVCVFINNAADKWYMRFGVTVHIPFSKILKSVKWW